jgi:hypothetical protein
MGRIIKNWTREEELYLKSNMSRLSYKEMAEHLGRHEVSVSHKMQRLELAKKVVPWSEEDIKYIKENYQHVTSKKMANLFGRPLTSFFQSLLNERYSYQYTADNKILVDFGRQNKQTEEKENGNKF